MRFNVFMSGKLYSLGADFHPSGWQETVCGGTPLTAVDGLVIDGRVGVCSQTTLVVTAATGFIFLWAIGPSPRLLSTLAIPCLGDLNELNQN